MSQIVVNLANMSDTLLNTTGKRVRLLRQDLRMNQATVGLELKKLGVDISQTYISKLENNDVVPNGRVIAGLAQVLNTTTDYLLLLTDDPFIPGEKDEDDPPRRPVSDAEWELLEQLRALPEVERLSFVETMRTMLTFANNVRAKTGHSFLQPGRPLALKIPQTRDDLRAVLDVLPDAASDELLERSREIVRKYASK
jgi:transcriptional regulator with XRE-family HTH domain